jgi:hypothetical integral membrane protein (TIGR02206 family)
MYSHTRRQCGVDTPAGLIGGPDRRVDPVRGGWVSSHAVSGIFAGPQERTRTFRLFSASHLLTVGLFAALNAAFAVFGWRIRGTPLDVIIRVGFGVTLYANELLHALWRLRHGLWSWKTSLPLHLCGVSIILSPIMLFTNSYLLFELGYFWTVGGAIQGLITPDVEGYDFPHFKFLTTFISHGLIITANLYMVFVPGMRPTFMSLVKSIVAVNVYALVAMAFNWITGANYGFFCRKPDTPTLFDYLGPWPWYLLTLEALAIAISFLLYVPFMI